MAISITQHHPTATNVFGEKTIMISRNGNHQYWIGEDKKNKMPSVTGITKYADAGSFGAGLGWAIKVGKENDGDLNSPRGLSLQVQKEGTDLHNSIDQYINNRTIDDDSVLFSTWLKTFANTTFLASEQLLYHKEMLYGGTADAFYFDPEDKSGTADIVLADWKTKERKSFESYGPPVKDLIQISAYVISVDCMSDIYTPQQAKIIYLFRDNSGIEIVDVDIERYFEVFRACHHLHTVLKSAQ